MSLTFSMKKVCKSSYIFFQNNSPTLVRAKCFHTLDAYVRLITLLVKHSGETQVSLSFCEPAPKRLTSSPMLRQNMLTVSPRQKKKIPAWAQYY
jgi:hypothetical protein